MAETTVNARIFIQMQNADAMRQQMRQGTLERFRQSGFGKALGQMHDGAMGAMNDAYRRVFEQGWFQKDFFDGRWHMDNQVGQEGGIHGMDRQYDQRASFYGWDNSPGTGGQTPEAGKEQDAQERDMDRGMER